MLVITFYWFYCLSLPSPLNVSYTQVVIFNKFEVIYLFVCLLFILLHRFCGCIIYIARQILWLYYLYCYTDFVVVLFILLHRFCGCIIYIATQILWSYYVMDLLSSFVSMKTTFLLVYWSLWNLNTMITKWHKIKVGFDLIYCRPYRFCCGSCRILYVDTKVFVQ